MSDTPHNANNFGIYGTVHLDGFWAVGPAQYDLAAFDRVEIRSEVPMKKVLLGFGYNAYPVHFEDVLTEGQADDLKDEGLWIRFTTCLLSVHRKARRQVRYGR